MLDRVIVREKMEVFPGDTYKMIDSNGEEFLIDGKDDPSLVALALAVDIFLAGLETNQREFALINLKAKFRSLPHRVVKQLDTTFVL